MDLFFKKIENNLKENEKPKEIVEQPSYFSTKLIPENINFKREYDTLVLSGGLKRGIVQLGLLYSLYQKKDKDFFKSIKKYYGTSVGSITCLFLSIDLSPLEMFMAICKTKMNITSNINVFNFLTKFGFFSSDELFSEIFKMIEKKLGFIPTMKELYEITGKELTIVVHNLTTNSTEYITHKNYENLSCIEALKMSCNIPIVFEKYYYNGSYYIDGGFSDNYPIEYACSFPENKNILAIRVGKKENKDNKDWNVVSYIKHLAYLTFKKQNPTYSNDKLDNVSVTIIEHKKEWDLDFSDTPEKFCLFSIGYNEGLKIMNNQGLKIMNNEKINDDTDILNTIDHFIKIENITKNEEKNDVEENISFINDNINDFNNIYNIKKKED